LTLGVGRRVRGYSFFRGTVEKGPKGSTHKEKIIFRGLNGPEKESPN